MYRQAENSINTLMATPNLLNLVINQGSDFNDLTFQLAHKCLTRCATKPSLVSTMIKIEPMGVTLPLGSILIYGCDDLVLSAPMGPNDRVIFVTMIPSSIPNGSMIQGPPIDITGWNIRSTIRDKTNNIIANFVGVIDNPILGKFKITLPSLVTTQLKANCTWKDLQGIDISLLGQPLESLLSVSSDTKKRIKKLLDSAYFWDVETIDNANIVARRSEGLIFVSGEVTK